MIYIYSLLIILLDLKESYIHAQIFQEHNLWYSWLSSYPKKVNLQNLNGKIRFASINWQAEQVHILYIINRSRKKTIVICRLSQKTFVNLVIQLCIISFGKEQYKKIFTNGQDLWNLQTFLSWTIPDIRYLTHASNHGKFQPPYLQPLQLWEKLM